MRLRDASRRAIVGRHSRHQREKSAGGCRTVEGRWGDGTSLCLRRRRRRFRGRYVSAILGVYSRIDILVNNAGVGGRFAPIQKQTNEDWHRVIGVDLTGVFLCCRAVVRLMIEQKYRRIINVSSLAGREGSPDMVPYSAAKAGVIGLTKALAREVAGHNIMVNVVAPAIIETPLLDEMPGRKKQLLLERTPLGRFGKPEAVAAMVHWLASDDVSYSTGAVFDLSGGRHVLKQPREGDRGEADCLPVRKMKRVGVQKCKGSFLHEGPALSEGRGSA